MKDAFSTIARFLLGGVCHQLPDRCLQYEELALPLCARCTGTFLGAMIALLILWAMRQGRRSQLPTWRLGLILAVLVGLWGVDGVNSLAQLVLGAPLLYEPRNSLRLATGMGFGLTIGIVIYPIYHSAMWREVRDKPILDREWLVAVPLLAGTVCIAILLGWRSAPYGLWLAVVSLAVLAVLALANATFIALLRHKAGFAGHWSEIVPLLLVGLLAALVEMGLLGLLRLFVLREWP